MRLIAFRIENYRSIWDSGWVSLDDIAVIVGKNESGKTTLLKGLWKFKPFHNEGYDLNREWPRSRRKEMSADKVVASVRFKFTPEEMTSLEKQHEVAKGLTGVEIQRNYRGEYSHNFLPRNPENVQGADKIMALIGNNLNQLPHGFSADFQDRYRPAFENMVREILGGTDNPPAAEKLAEFKQLLPSLVSTHNPGRQQDAQSLPKLLQTVDQTLTALKATPLRRLADTVQQMVPTFIYMDEQRSFCGTAQLDKVKQRRDEHCPKPEDEALIRILEMANLNLDEEVRKGASEDKEQRQLDMNDASQTLTNLLADRWSQKKYEIELHADGQHFITFVRDASSKVLVPLEERSKGFQWFFSFDLMFMHETQGMFANSIILLDEPGLHLHAAAQADLLKRLQVYAQNNQIIYTTHLPFMIDFNQLENVYIAEDLPREGVKIHKRWSTADKDARFALQAALALSWCQSLAVGQYNLLVEEITDYLLLTSISTLLTDADQEGFHEKLVITPVGGGTRAAHLGVILQGENLNAGTLLNSNPNGDNSHVHMMDHWVMNTKRVLRLGDVLSSKEQPSLEDLFDDTYYLAHVNTAYKRELAGKPLILGLDGTRPVVERAREALQKQNVGGFDRSRVARHITLDLAKKNLADLPPATVNNFKKIVTAVNGIFSGS